LADKMIAGADWTADEVGKGFKALGHAIDSLATGAAPR